MNDDIHCGTYVAWRFSMENEVKLEKWLKDNNIVPDLGTYSWYLHATVIYALDISLPGIARGIIDPVVVPSANLSWKLLPTLNNRESLVIQMKCDELVKRHEELKSMGARHAFLKYVPHVTICYSLKKPVSQIYLPLPNFDLVFDFEYQSNIN